MLKIGQNQGKIANYPPQCSTKIGTFGHDSHVIPLLDFRLSSYEPYRKFLTYFVSVFCSNLKLMFFVHNKSEISYISVGNFRLIL